MSSTSRSAGSAASGLHPDAALVARVRAGDAAAFASVFTGHYESLCGYVLSYVRDAGVAEELVQDVFAAVWRQHEQWAPDGPIRHYLLAAARNRAVSYLRHHRIVEETAARYARDGQAPAMGAGPAAPDELAQASEFADALRRAIHELPERRRQVVTLRWHHRMSHAEIAHVLGISVKGVETQLVRGLASLRERLAAFRP